MKPAECLTNLKLKDGWTVVSIIKPAPRSTGGHFSIGYLVRNSNGKKAYLKALDFSTAFQAPDPARELQSMTEAYNFERDILTKCKDRKLSRVVTPIADGTVTVAGNFGHLGTVCYLIFEHARGDIRKEIEQFAAFDLAWCLRSLHQTAVGLKQLHGAGIAHQDLKPSNVLVFSDAGSKIADLGRASDSNLKSQFDHNQVPGDVGYAPPEQFYYSSGGREFSDRCLSDLYLLGSLFFFYFTGCSATQAMQAKTRGFKGINFSNNDFHNDLPYIKRAFNESVQDLKAEIIPFAGDLADEIIKIVIELCEPDPKLRGDRQAIGRQPLGYNLERYVSRLNLLARKAEYKII